MINPQKPASKNQQQVGASRIDTYQTGQDELTPNTKT